MLDKKKITVIIPCRNEEQHIEECIESIINSEDNLDLFNIVICDGLSTDKTIQKIENLTEKFNFIHYIQNTKQTTQYALNLGIKIANSDFILIMGAHCKLKPKYISTGIDILSTNNDIACVGGVVENIFENSISRIIGYAMSSSFGVGVGNFRTIDADIFVDTVGTPIYKSEIFEKVGFFDEELVRNQDDEFNYRVKKANYKIFLSKNMKMEYFVRASLKKLYKQYYQYGYWKVYVNKKHKTITTIRQIVPLLFVVFILFGGLLSFTSKIILFLYLSILFFYMILAFIFAYKKSNKPVDIFLIIYSFLILHISYGLGFMEGIIDFFIFRKKPKENNMNLSR